MIEFIQDYTTKSLPPESFADGQQVERSPESELYFVRLGVAGFLIDGKVVDQDHQAIVRQTVVVVTADRRFADTGRAGEVIGLDAPQRATSGPGNAVVFAGQPENVSLSQVEVDQLRADLGSVQLSFDEHRTESGAEIDRLKGLIESANEAFRTADSAFSEERTTLSAARDEAVGELADTRRQLEAANERVAELERQLAEAAAPKQARGK